MQRKLRSQQPQPKTSTIGTTGNNSSGGSSDEDIPLNQITKRKRGRPPKTKRHNKQKSDLKLDQKCSIPDSQDLGVVNTDDMSQSITETKIGDLVAEKSLTTASCETSEGAERVDHNIEEVKVSNSISNLDEVTPEITPKTEPCQHTKTTGDELNDNTSSPQTTDIPQVNTEDSNMKTNESFTTLESEAHEGSGSENTNVIDHQIEECKNASNSTVICSDLKLLQTKQQLDENKTNDICNEFTYSVEHKIKNLTEDEPESTKKLTTESSTNLAAEENHAINETESKEESEPNSTKNSNAEIPCIESSKLELELTNQLDNDNFVVDKDNVEVAKDMDTSEKNSNIPNVIFDKSTNLEHDENIGHNAAEPEMDTSEKNSIVPNVIFDKSTDLEHDEDIGHNAAEPESSTITLKNAENIITPETSTNNDHDKLLNKSEDHIDQKIIVEAVAECDTSANEASKLNNVTDNASSGDKAETKTDLNNVNSKLSSNSDAIEEPHKKFNARQHKKWLALQKKLQLKYGIEPKSTETNESKEVKSENVSSVKKTPDEIKKQPEIKNESNEEYKTDLNKIDDLSKNSSEVATNESQNVKSENVSSVKKTPDEMKKQPEIKNESNEENNTDLNKIDELSKKSSEVASAATGVEKFLHLMNILNKNPEKCKKWLENQDLLRNKLSEKYKEPIIYSTVKLISLGQEESLKSSSNKSLLKVTNSLDLLNLLYSNPEKCKMWLIKEEELKKKQGKEYQEPAIYSTVKLIAVTHSKSVTKDDTKIIKNESKEFDEKKTNELNIKPQQTSTKETDDTYLSDSKKCTSSHNISENSINKPELLPHTNLVTEEQSFKPPCNSSKKIKQDKSGAKTSDNEIQTICQLNDTSYVLFPPSVVYKNVQKVIHRQKTLRKLLGSQYRIPTYNNHNKKESFANTLGKKIVLLVPLSKNRLRQINFGLPLHDYNTLDWIQNEIKLMNELGDAYKEPTYTRSDVNILSSSYEVSSISSPSPYAGYPPMLSSQPVSTGLDDNFSGVGFTHTQPSLIDYYPPPADFTGMPPADFTGMPPADFTAPPHAGLTCPPPPSFTVNHQYSANYHASNYSASMCNPPPPGIDVQMFPLPYTNDQSAYVSSEPINLPNAPSGCTVSTPNYLPQNIPSAYTSYEHINLSNPPSTNVSSAPVNLPNTPSCYAASAPVNLPKVPSTYNSFESINLPNVPPARTSSEPINSPNAPCAYTLSSTPINLPKKKKQKPKEFTEFKPTISKPAQIYKTVGVKKTVQSNRINEPKSTDKQSNEENSDDLKIESKTEDFFSTEKCSNNVAFRFKGKEVYYPFFVKDFFSRKKWVDNQRNLYKKKGNLYTPPEFTEDGKLAAHHLKKNKNTDANITTVAPTAIQEAKQAYLDSIASEAAIDKFGMRVNLNSLNQLKQLSTSNTQNEKKKITLNDVFSAIPKIQPPPDKTKIAVKFKKDEKKNKKKNKSNVEPSKYYEDTECKSIRVAHQHTDNNTKLSVDLYTKPVQYPGFPVSNMKMAQINLSRSQDPPTSGLSTVPKPPAGWPVSMIKAMVPPPPPEMKVKSESSTRPPTPPPPHIELRTSGKSKASAFERLGPPTEPKKPKLTVNLIADDKTNEVTRKVVEQHVPVYLRKDVLKSKDAIVKEYLDMWPWSKPVKILRECSAKSMDPVLDEIEMMPCYVSKSLWIKVVATGYPSHFKKEDVLDFLLSVVEEKEFIPCFIEFTPKECIFLLNRSEHALTYLHNNGLIAKKDGLCINLLVSQTNLTLDNLRFYKGGVFKTKLLSCYDEEFKSLNLSAFQMQPDNSHFMYFPLNVPHNQIFVMNVVKALLPWKHITMLDLSANRLTNVTSVNLSECFPSLRILDLSKNLLPTVSTLACFKGIPMYSLALDGNPLCRNFVQQEHYIHVVKLIFPCLLVLDGIKVDDKQELKKNFSVSSEAVELVNSFMEIFFTLTDCSDRTQIESLYCDKSVFSITCRPEMKRNVMYHNLREFYMWCRCLKDSMNPVDPFEGTISGAAKIVRYFTKWPATMHDPHTFTVDIMQHTETTTIFKVTGLFKIPAENLNQDEPVTEFSRTFVIATEDGVEYRIMNDMMHISEATPERISSAFKYVSLNNPLTLIDASSLRFENPPDNETKVKLEDILSQLTGLRRSQCTRCLDLMDWNLKKSLEYFMKLEKVDAVESLQL